MMAAEARPLTKREKHVWWGVCRRKVAHARDVAEREAARLNAMNEADTARVDAYQCGFCGRWHCGRFDEARPLAKLASDFKVAQGGDR